jgi:hypothetical protein
MAKGALIAQKGCTPDEAFTRLVNESQRRNVRLHVIAQELLASLQAPQRTRSPFPKGRAKTALRLVAYLEINTMPASERPHTHVPLGRSRHCYAQDADSLALQIRMLISQAARKCFIKR